MSAFFGMIGKWLLEKLGSFIATWVKKTKRKSQIDKEEDAQANSQKEIVTEIYRLEGLTVMNGSDKHKKILKQIAELREKLRELSRKINAGWFT